MKPLYKTLLILLAILIFEFVRFIVLTNIKAVAGAVILIGIAAVVMAGIVIGVWDKIDNKN